MSDSIAILAPSSVPFQVGGAEKFWWSLREALAQYSGKFVELIKIPAPEDNFAQIVDSYRQFSRLDLSHFHMVVTTKYPAWMIAHANHVLYMQHPLRGLYDTYAFTGLPETLADVPDPLRELVCLARKPNPTREDLDMAFDLVERLLRSKSVPSGYFKFPGPLIRELVHFFDRVAMARGQISAWLAISRTVRERENYIPDYARVKILPHPSDIRDFKCGEGKYIFTASRLTSSKRVHLLVDAMRHVRGNVTFKIAGTGPELEHLRARAANDPRVEFLGHVPDNELPVLYANALFVPFVPYDEDYGLITLEAMRSGKAVLTATDSGGVTEFVRQGITGICAPPTPESLGKAMREMLDNPQKTRQMGQKAKESVVHINWQATAREFFAHAALSQSLSSPHCHPKILVCSHFPASATGAGGQRRLYHLCAALSQKYEVALVTFNTFQHQKFESVKHTDNFMEMRLPWPEEAITKAANPRGARGAGADDVTLMLSCKASGMLREILKGQAKSSRCLVVSHPYLYPAVESLNSPLPLIYDAHNVEADIKTSMLAGASPDILNRVRETEGKCVSRASRILVCSRVDGERFCNLYGARPDKCLLAPNGYDSIQTPYTGPKERAKLRGQLPYPRARLALFLGSGHAPNIEAAGHIVKIAGKAPEVEFLIAGSVSTQPETKKMPWPKNAHLLGIVPEKLKTALLQTASLAINPVLSGSGTNLKVVEYLGAGLECVSTPFGMRGMEEFAVSVRLGSTEEFPDLVREVFNAPTSSDILRATAQKIGRELDWKQVFSKAVACIDELCAVGENHAAAD